MVQPKKRLYRNDVSAETREKQSIAHQGRKHSNGTKQRISKSMCDYWAKLPSPITPLLEKSHLLLRFVFLTQFRIAPSSS